MDGYSISQTAERTGFTPSALRFYEREGLVRPNRTETGYRCYTDGDLATLRFVARLKGLGLALDKVAGLVPLFRGGRCAPVQERLREVVDAELDRAEARVAELTEATAELRRAAAGLRVHTPDGPCDRECGCADRSEAEEPAIVCTLDHDAWPGRMAEWRATLASATSRVETASGVRFQFERSVDAGALAALAAAENDCCRWMTFTITISPGAVTMDVTGSAAARAVIVGLYAMK